jgi:LPS O-antigen subunit length determinant protein (WzzB/FepE family)
MTETTPQKPAKKIAWILLLGVIGLGLISAGFVLLNKFEKDRMSAMNFEPQKMTPRPNLPSNQPVTRTYTKEEIEEARKSGKPLPGLPKNQVMPNTTGEDAVQRSLRTLDEINRINEMNRRLLEQQQRQQK